MTNSFAGDHIAAGYAKARPPLHRHILERAKPHVVSPVSRALDVGCGAGLSTQALDGFAIQRIGIEPGEHMLRWRTAVAPGADFLAATAEAIPLAAGSVDLITAAGSLNYVRSLDRFFAEAARVLTRDGVLIVYDFSPGRSFGAGERGLEEWFAAFQNRYPCPDDGAVLLSPDILAGRNSGFRMRASEKFAIGLHLSPEFYIEYILTETNVAHAIRSGTPGARIRSWCEETLARVWEGRPHEVVFEGYFACMERNGP